MSYDVEVTSMEGETQFDFDHWIAANELNDIRDVFIKHNMTIAENISMHSDTFKNFISDPQLVVNNFQLISKAVSAIQKMEAQPLNTNSNANNDTDESNSFVVISEDENSVMNNIKANISKLGQIDNELNSLTSKYPQSVQKVKEEKVKQVDKTEKKVHELFQNIYNELEKKRQIIITKLQNIKYDAINDKNDYKEMELMSSSCRKIESSRKILSQNLNLCTNKLKSETIESRKSAIIKIGTKSNEMFSKTEQEINKQMKNMKRVIDANNNMQINIDFEVNDVTYNTILSKINKIGVICNSGAADDEKSSDLIQNNNNLKDEKDKSDQKQELTAVKQNLKDIEEDLHKHLNNNEFLEAIVIHCDITDKIFGELKDVSCLELMRKRFRGGTKMITTKLKTELLSIISEAPYLNNNKLLIIWKSYFKLNCFHEVNALLEEICCNLLFIKCIRVLCRHLGYNQSYIDRNYGFDKTRSNLTDSTYKNLCRKLKPTQFMACFMDICGRVFDILHVYYKTESILIKFRSESEILRGEDMTLVRKQLWIETQNLLCELLECSQFSLKTKMKMEDLLLSLHGAAVFKIIGEAFSGSDSVKLHTSIRHKCISYLDHFRVTFFESIKTNFDNEMWLVLPIAPHFGIHSIKELQPNTQWTIAGSTEEEEKKKDAELELALQESNAMSIYQSFLSGDNIFDKLLRDKKESDCRQNNINQRIASNDDASEPCITSTSLNLAKCIGECVQIMESLDPVAPETFLALKNSFNFYLYHVFIWFGVNVHNFFNHQETNEYTSALDKLGDDYHNVQLEEAQEQQRKIQRIAQQKYPILTQIINQVNESLRNRTLAPELEDLIQKKLNNNVLRPRRLPHYAKCYMEASEELDLYSQKTMQGVAARFVATETLTFLVQVIKSQRGRLIKILNKSCADSRYTKQVSSFIKQTENVVIEFKKYMYRNVPTLLVHLGSQEVKESIISHINNTNWNLRQLATEPSFYVSELISIFTHIESVLGSFQTLPQFIHNRLNKEAIIYVEEQLVEAYADCKRCTAEGRALMSLDQSVLKKSYPIQKYQHSWEYTTNFIQAYYLPQVELLQWIKQHPEYPLKAHKSFLTVGRASENLRRKERLLLEKEIERIYRESKQYDETGCIIQ